jgi:hypothetical protein
MPRFDIPKQIFAENLSLQRIKSSLVGRPLKYWDGSRCLWILALAKARSAVSISAMISAKRATPANAKINATVDGARQKGS